MNRRDLIRQVANLGIAGLVSISSAHMALAQSQPRQAGNATYEFANSTPAYAKAQGPRIIIHRAVSPYVIRGSFDPFTVVAESDGFVVNWLDAPLTKSLLDQASLLVVANPYTKGGALDYRNFGTLSAPSVYSPEEISMIAEWVRSGGALLLLADHSPFAGGGIKLAEAFGFTFMTGFAIHKSSTAQAVITNVEYRKDGKAGIRIGRLADHPITNGGLGREPLESFYAFGGQAIIPPPEAQNLLTLPDGFETILTFALTRDFNTAARLDATSLSQGAVREFGEGRVAVFGETGAFTSQIIDGVVGFGMGSPDAPQNEEFVLSVLRWLAGHNPD